MSSSSRSPLATAALTVAQITGEYSILIMPFILAAMMEAFRVSEATAGRLVSLQLLGMAGGSALVTLMLRVGNSLRPVLGVGAAAIIVANAVCASVDAPFAVYGARALTGLGEGAVMAAAGAAVCATPDPHRVFSVIAMTIAVLAIVILLVTPFLATHWGPAGLFWLLAMIPLLLVVMLRWIPTTASDSSRAPGTTLAGLRRGAPLLLASLAFWCGSSGLWVYAERIGAYQGLIPEQVGFWLSVGQVGGLAGPIASAWAVPRFGARPALFVGCLGMAAATISFIFGGQPWTYGLGGFLASFWLMFVVPCLRGRMANLDPSGRTLAASAGVYTAGFGLAPLVVSSVTTEGHGYVNTGIFCIACFMASAILGAARGADSGSRALASADK